MFVLRDKGHRGVSAEEITPRTHQRRAPILYCHDATYNVALCNRRRTADGGCWGMTIQCLTAACLTIVDVLIIIQAFTVNNSDLSLRCCGSVQ